MPHFKETFDTVEVWQEHDIYRLSKVKEKKSDNIQQTSRFDSKTFEKVFILVRGISKVCIDFKKYYEWKSECEH